MVLLNVHLLPLFVFVLIPTSFIIPYCIAVYLKHVEIGFPYISDTGAFPPESCIFSQGVNLIAFSVVVLMYVRYKHVEQHCRDHLSSESTIVLKMNQLALLVGLFGCFGLSLTANFQETSVIIVHTIGASFAFGFATIYCWLQSMISYYFCPLMNSRLVARIRVFISVVMTVTFCTSITAGVIAHKKFHGKDATKWYPEDGGLLEHIISSVAEWVLVAAFDVFVLTFVREMQKISISSPQVIFKIEDLTLHSRDFYNSEDPIQISSPNSLRVTTLPSSPYGDFGKDNVLTTSALVH